MIGDGNRSARSSAARSVPRPDAREHELPCSRLPELLRPLPDAERVADRQGAPSTLKMHRSGGLSSYR